MQRGKMNEREQVQSGRLEHWLSELEQHAGMSKDELDLDNTQAVPANKDIQYDARVD